MAQTAKTILITGANRGIGLALARRFVARGDRVLAGCRDPDGASDLHALGPGATAFPLDVADPRSVAALADRVAGTALDGAIANAGVFPGKGQRIGGDPLDFDGFAEAMAVNAAGPFRVLEAILPALRAGRDRKVLTVSSQMGSVERSPGGAYWYRASKAAVNALMRNAARDLAGEGFSLLLVHPGWVRTDMGGDGADISVDESADGIVALYDRMDAETNGAFLSYDGRPHPF